MARLAQLALCDVLCTAISRPHGEEVANVAKCIVKCIAASAVHKHRTTEDEHKQEGRTLCSSLLVVFALFL